jgi:hypothetical protein
MSGGVYYYRDDTLNQNAGGEPSTKPVAGVSIDLTGFATGHTTSDSAGAYSFGNLFGGVTVTPASLWGGARATNLPGVIGSLDASAIARAAVQLILLTTNQRTAGDVTGDSTISAFDASYVARFAAQLVSHFPVAETTGSDWKFVPISYVFPAIGQPETGKDFLAILYGDVTGNWSGPQLARGFPMAAKLESSPETLAPDQALVDQFKHGAAPAVERLNPGAPAGLWMADWPAPLRAGERREVTINLDDADGILGLDLSLTYDASKISIVGAQASGIGSQFFLAQSNQKGTYRIAGYGLTSLSGSGSVLTVTVEALQNLGRDIPIRISGVANEGGIALEVRGKGKR